MNIEMASTVGFYYKNDFYGSPVPRNLRIPNYNIWEFFHNYPN